MQSIQPTNNLNFNGTFIVNYARAAKGTRKIIEEKYTGARKFVIDNFNDVKPNEVIYVIRDTFDLQMAKALKLNELPTKYYPNINTRNQCNTFARVEKEIQSTDKSIAGAGRAVKFIEDTGRLSKSEPKAKIDLRSNIIARLNLFFTPTKPVCKKGVYICNNITGEKGSVTMSQFDKNGNFFIKVEEHEPNAPSKYYKFNKETNELLEYNSASGILQFRKDFNTAQAFYKSKNK